jgi:hypothetical protein
MKDMKKLLAALFVALLMVGCEGDVSSEKRIIPFWQESKSETEETKDFICNKCGELFSRVLEADGLDCPKAYRVRHKSGGGWRTREQVDQILNSMSWEPLDVSRDRGGIYGVIRNINRIDPRYKIPTGVRRSTSSTKKSYPPASQQEILNKRLIKYHIIPEKYWYEYPHGKAHDLIRN